MSIARLLERLAPPGLEPSLWSAVLDLAEAPGRVTRGWTVSVQWEETEAPFAAVAEFFRGEQTAFPRLPLGNMNWALEAEERAASRYRIGARGVTPLGEEEDLRAPWLALYLVTARGEPARALVGTVRRSQPSGVDDAIARALAPLEPVPLLGEAAVSFAEQAVDRERSAILARERDGTWSIAEPIRGC